MSPLNLKSINMRHKCSMTQDHDCTKLLPRRQKKGITKQKMLAIRGENNTLTNDLISLSSLFTSKETHIIYIYIVTKARNLELYYEL